MTITLIVHIDEDDCNLEITATACRFTIYEVAPLLNVDAD